MRLGCGGGRIRASGSSTWGRGAPLPRLVLKRPGAGSQTITSAVPDRLATTFPSEAGVDSRAQRDSTALEVTLTHAELIGAAPGIGTMAPHSESKPIYLPPFYVATGGPTETGPPVLADTDGPRGTENRLGRFATEKRQPYRSRKRSAPSAEGYNSEGTENFSEEETRRHHGAARKYRHGRHRRYRDDRDGRYTRYRCDNCDGPYERYCDARGGAYLSDDDDTTSDESRRSDRWGRGPGHRRRLRREDSDPDGYISSGGERDPHRGGRDGRSAPRRDPKGLPVIRPLNDLFAKSVDYRKYRLESRSARYDTSSARRITIFGRSSRCR